MSMTRPAPPYSDDQLHALQRNTFALDQGPVVLMIENDRSGLIWRLMRNCPDVAAGLRRAGFRGGWLTAPRPATPDTP